MSEELKKKISEFNTKELKVELKKRGFKVQKKTKRVKEEYSRYGSRMVDTCHMGYECGVSGMTCNATSCPHT
jgi:hypothetical protein